jgi:tetratricopeptide (TPR) repeat protein
MLLRIVDLYANESRSEAAKRIAAQFLANLATELQQVGLEPLAQSVFQQALELDGDNEAALLSLAASFERRGAYQRAIELLDLLVATHPKSGEARLRLALNLGRLEREKQAHELLGDLLNGEYPAWVVSVAYQELADSYLEDSRLEEAERLLEAGIARLPGEEKLYLQLAMLYDSRRRPGRAREILAAMDGRVEGAVVSPRHRYCKPAEETLERLRAQIDESVASRLPALAAIVAREPTVDRQ